MLKPELSEVPEHISDEPRYEHRGVIVDVSQEYFDIDFLKTVMDTLSMLKVNKVLLHMMDDDSFPFEMSSFPDMGKETAFTPDEVYSIEDVAEIVSYAKDRGITINPEISVPSHLRPLHQVGAPYVVLCEAQNQEF